MNLSEAQGRAKKAGEVRARIQELEAELPERKAALENRIPIVQEALARKLVEHILGEVSAEELDQVRQELAEADRFLKEYGLIIAGLQIRFKIEQQIISASAGEIIRAANAEKFPKLKAKLQRDFLNGVIPGTYYFGENCEALMSCAEICGREAEAKAFIERYYREEN